MSGTLLATETAPEYPVGFPEFDCRPRRNLEPKDAATRKLPPPGNHFANRRLHRSNSRLRSDWKVLRMKFALSLFTVLRLASSAVVVCLGLAGVVRGAEPFEAFLTKHCIRCHGARKEEGDLQIDQLSRDFKSGVDTHHWAEALDKVNSGEMPPETEPQPTQAEIEAFVTSLDARLKEGRAARMAARPAVAHYRLSRKEYQNTVYDLLGVRYDPTKPGELNEDTLWHGFELIGSELSLSPSHVDRYYGAAGLVLDRAFPVTAGESRKVHKTAADLRYGGGKTQQEALDRFGICLLYTSRCV